MLDYDMVHFPPSQIAAGAFCLALKILDNGEWVSSVPQADIILSFGISLFAQDRAVIKGQSIQLLHMASSEAMMMISCDIFLECFHFIA